MFILTIENFPLLLSPDLMSSGGQGRTDVPHFHLYLLPKTHSIYRLLTLRSMREPLSSFKHSHYGGKLPNQLI